MLYIKCPSCGTFLGKIEKKWKDEKTKICDNPKLLKEEKEELLTNLLLSFKLRYCCNLRVMTYKDLVQEILPINN
jgi:DNA-directed RNA polymerase subunit N (RpoN/RPB10)